MQSVCALAAAACFVAVAISAADMICPEKNFEKQMRIIFSMIFITAVIAPIVSGKVNIELPDISENAYSVEYPQEEINLQLKSEIEANVCNGLSDALKEKNVPVKEISVNVNIEDENSISISKVDFKPCNSADSECIKTEIRSLLGDDVEISGGGENAE